MAMNWPEIEALGVSIPVVFGFCVAIVWRVLKYEHVSDQLKIYKEMSDSDRKRIEALESQLSGIPAMELRISFYERDRIKDGMEREGLRTQISILEQLYECLSDLPLSEPAKNTVLRISAQLGIERERSRKQIYEWEQREDIIRQGRAAYMVNDPRITPLDSEHTH